GPTELRILLSIGTMVLYVKPTVSLFGLGQFLLFDVCFGVAAAGLLTVLAVSAARMTADLYRAEPLPPRTVTQAAGPQLEEGSVSTGGRGAAQGGPM
ncbi:MAG: hypothetical protein AB7F99_17820, partial [Vicinamibacterales bacterium]